jgi:hypothetical protein
MPGPQGGIIRGTQNNVILDTIAYDCTHSVELTASPNGYRLNVNFGVPYKLDASASGGNVVSNAAQRRDLIYQRETLTREFNIRMGESAIKTMMASFLDSANTAEVAGIVPGINNDVRDLVDSMIDTVVNPAATTSTTPAQKDPNEPTLI